MTALNCVIHRENRFYIIGMKGTGLPFPEELGLTPAPTIPGEYSGYYCDYSIKDEKLLLTHLVIRTKDEVYPPIGDVQAIVEEEHVVDEHTPREHLRGRYFYRYDDMGPEYVGYDGAIYAGLSVTTQFTGELILAKDLSEYLYIAMELKNTAQLERLFELVFENGKLIAEARLSQKIAQLRAQLELRTEIGNENLRDAQILDWIKREYSLEQIL